MNNRLEKLRHNLDQNRLDAIIISQAENRRYFSGFTGSAGFLLVTEKSAILATDFRYIEQAQGQAPDFEIFRSEGELGKWFTDLISSLGVKRIGFEASDISFAAYRKLAAAGMKESLCPQRSWWSPCAR